MVIVGHHLIEYGVASSVDSLWQVLRIGLVVQRVLHLTALGLSGTNQRLRLVVEGQRSYRCGSRWGDVGPIDGEGSHHLSVVQSFTDDGSLAGAGVHVVLIAHAEVRVLCQIGLTVLHSYGGCQRLS